MTTLNTATIEEIEDVPQTSVNVVPSPAAGPNPPPSLTIMFCLPGANFSAEFMQCWTELAAFCLKSGITPRMSAAKSCNIYYVRNMCLGASVLRGSNQQPFDGKENYDYLMWIDSDIVFNARQFERLLSHKKPIVSGLYLMENGVEYATVRKWDENYFKQHGTFQFLNNNDINAFEGDLMEVSYTGFGWMLIRHGVFESMTYPWFKQREIRIKADNGVEVVDMTMEDATFCLEAAEQGYKVFVDPRVIVGHQKLRILAPIVQETAQASSSDSPNQASSSDSPNQASSSDSTAK